MLCKVLDLYGTELAPTKKEKAWYKVRKGKAELISKEPMIIKLNKIVNRKEEGNIMGTNEENYVPLSVRARKLTLSDVEDVEQYYKEQKEWGEARADYCFDNIHKILFKYYQNHLIDHKDKDFWCRYQNYYDLSEEEIEEKDISNLKTFFWDLKGSYEFCTVFKNKTYSCKDCYSRLNHYALMLYGAYLKQEEKKRGDKEC